ncbi:MAG TPA: hypothetical protein EYG70_00925 [Sulfurimonas sp.]|nr:hypothetical protein [Sulfurimonas sp.]
MKITKMSLVAALLIGSSAFAIENTKVTGDVNVYYMTQDKANSGLATSDGGLFEAANSAADIGLNLNLTTDLYKADALSISAGVGYTVLTTLGLENNLVGNVWGGAHTADAATGSYYGHPVNGAKVNNAAWVNEAWIAISAAKTTIKVGRMELDTPLAFTEKWSIEKNTFEAAVVINQDIPNTTLVGAFVGNGNGTETFGQNAQSIVQGVNLAVAPVVNGNGDFTTYGSDGAYAIAVINNSWKPLTVQAWYYDVTRIATASWLQADLNMDGILAGIQYSTLDISTTKNQLGTIGDKTNVNVSSSATAVMLGYAMKDVMTVKASYSVIGKDHSAGQNTATDFIGGTAQSKLYTEAWWNYGQVTKAGAKAINLTVEAPTSVADLGLYFTNVTQNANETDLTELTVTASKSLGPVDATLAYIYTNLGDGNAATNDSLNALQVYLTVNF